MFFSSSAAFAAGACVCVIPESASYAPQRLVDFAAPDLARFVTRWGQTAPIANATSTFVSDGTAIKVGATGRAGRQRLLTS